MARDLRTRSNFDKQTKKQQHPPEKKKQLVRNWILELVIRDAWQSFETGEVWNSNDLILLENKKDDDNSGENEVSPEQQLLWLLTVLNKVLFEKKNGAELPDDNKPTTLEEAITLWPEVTKGQVNSENVLHMLRVQAVFVFCRAGQFDVAEQVYSRVWAGVLPGADKMHASLIRDVIKAKKQKHPRLMRDRMSTCIECVKNVVSSLISQLPEPFLLKVADRSLAQEERSTQRMCPKEDTATHNASNSDSNLVSHQDFVSILNHYGASDRIKTQLCMSPGKQANWARKRAARAANKEGYLERASERQRPEDPTSQGGSEQTKKGCCTSGGCQAQYHALADIALQTLTKSRPELERLQNHLGFDGDPASLLHATNKFIKRLRTQVPEDTINQCLMRLEDTTSQSDEETTSEECTPPPISNDISMPLLTPNEDYTHLQMHHKDRPRRAIQRNEEQTSQNRRHDRSSDNVSDGMRSPAKNHAMTRKQQAPGPTVIVKEPARNQRDASPTLILNKPRRKQRNHSPNVTPTRSQIPLSPTVIVREPASNQTGVAPVYRISPQKRANRSQIISSDSEHSDTILTQSPSKSTQTNRSSAGERRRQNPVDSDSEEEIFLCPQSPHCSSSKITKYLHPVSSPSSTTRRQPLTSSPRRQTAATSSNHDRRPATSRTCRQPATTSSNRDQHPVTTKSNHHRQARSTTSSVVNDSEVSDLDGSLTGRMMPLPRRRRCDSISSTASIRRVRRMWTPEEELNVVRGVKRFGEGRWRDIKDHFQFNNRTNVDIKDKWRQLNKSGAIGALNDML